MPLVSVRGAAGLNLQTHAAEPDAVVDLLSCRNIDLSVKNSVMPRLGLLRLTSFPGLMYDEATGGVYTGIGALTAPITRIIENPSVFIDKPGVDT